MFEKNRSEARSSRERLRRLATKDLEAKMQDERDPYTSAMMMAATIGQGGMINPRHAVAQLNRLSNAGPVDGYDYSDGMKKRDAAVALTEAYADRSPVDATTMSHFLRSFNEAQSPDTLYIDYQDALGKIIRAGHGELVQKDLVELADIFTDRIARRGFTRHANLAVELLLENMAYMGYDFSLSHDADDPVCQKLESLYVRLQLDRQLKTSRPEWQVERRKARFGSAAAEGGHFAVALNFRDAIQGDDELKSSVTAEVYGTVDDEEIALVLAGELDAYSVSLAESYENTAMYMRAQAYRAEAHMKRGEIIEAWNALEAIPANKMPLERFLVLSTMYCQGITEARPKALALLSHLGIYTEDIIGDMIAKIAQTDSENGLFAQAGSTVADDAENDVKIPLILGQLGHLICRDTRVEDTANDDGFSNIETSMLTDEFFLEFNEKNKDHLHNGMLAVAAKLLAQRGHLKHARLFAELIDPAEKVEYVRALAAIVYS